MKKILISASLLAASLPVQAVETAVGLSASTFGAGVEVIFSINEHLSVRGHFSKATVNLDDYIADLDAIQDSNATGEGEFDIGAMGVLFDYHPFGGKFRMSTGLLQNNNELIASAAVINEPIGSATAADCGVPGNCYTGDLSLGVDMGGTVPYFGIGFGSAASEGIPFGFGIDIGVVPMNIDIAYTLEDNLQGISQAAIDEEIEEIKKDTDDFKLYPFINLMASYRF